MGRSPVFYLRPDIGIAKHKFTLEWVTTRVQQLRVFRQLWLSTTFIHSLHKGLTSIPSRAGPLWTLLIISVSPLMLIVVRTEGQCLSLSTSVPFFLRPVVYPLILVPVTRPNRIDQLRLVCPLPRIMYLSMVPYMVLYWIRKWVMLRVSWQYYRQLPMV